MGVEATYFLCIPVSHSRNPSSQMLAKGPTCKPFWKVALGLLAERFPAYLLTGSLLNKSARVIFFFLLLLFWLVILKKQNIKVRLSHSC